MHQTIPTEAPSLEMGHPTEEQLAKINRYRPRGTPPIQSHEVISIPFIASDNLMSRSYGVWEIDSLYTMAKLFPGRPFELDHRHEQVEKSVGFVYDSAIIRVQSASPELLNSAGNFDINRQIVARDGLVQLVLYTCVEATSEVVSGVRFRRLGDVSTAGFTTGEYTCPLCSISFDNPSCPHFIPDWWSFMLAKYGEIDADLIAPYFIRGSFMDAIELSLCVCGNLPGASLVIAGDE